MAEDDKLAGIDRRLGDLEHKMDRVLTFVDECTGGRKALLTTLKGIGALAAAGAAVLAALRMGLRP